MERRIQTFQCRQRKGDPSGVVSRAWRPGLEDRFEEQDPVAGGGRPAREPCSRLASQRDRNDPAALEVLDVDAGRVPLDLGLVLRDVVREEVEKG